MGEIFSPCLAVAWLLTSRFAVCNCEIVLGCSVLREEDLDGAFRTATDTSTWTSAEECMHTRRSCCLESILQGLAALEVSWLREGTSYNTAVGFVFYVQLSVYPTGEVTATTSFRLISSQCNVPSRSVLIQLSYDPRRFGTNVLAVLE